MGKEYKTCAQQVEILRNRGMLFLDANEESFAKSILSRHNYYNIINGYKDIFLDNSSTTSVQDVYKPNTKFSDIYTVYNFDRKLRSIYLKYILIAENIIKTIISHEFSKVYGHDNYLIISNFDNSSQDNIKDIIKLIGDIHQETARQLKKNNKTISHYMSVYGYIPLWILVKSLTFGKVETFYKLMKEQDKISIGKLLKIQHIKLYNYINILTLARNMCAHDERFYNIKYKNGVHPGSINNFSILDLKKDIKGNYIHGINDVYAVAIILTLIMDKQEVKSFIDDLDNLFSNIKKEIDVAVYDKILDTMGFQDNDWKKLLLL